MDGLDRYLNDVTKKEHSTRSTYLHLHLHLLLIPRIAEPKSSHVTSRHIVCSTRDGVPCSNPTRSAQSTHEAGELNGCLLVYLA
jgi:hypothetical protein